MARQELGFLITGCGRSGTTYMAELLNLLDIDAGNERVATAGIVGWQFAFDTPLTYVKGRDSHQLRIRPSEYSFRRTLQQVRHPLKVIASCHTVMPRNWLYIEQLIPIRASDSLTLRCMKYWYHWNKAAQARAHSTYRIEEIDDYLGTLLSEIGFPEKRAQMEKVKGLSRKTNSRPKRTRKGSRSYKPVELADLRAEDEELTEKIIQLASEYGYDLSPP